MAYTDMSKKKETETRYRDAHRDQVRATQKRYRENHRERVAASTRAWALSNPEKVREIRDAYKARANELSRAAYGVRKDRITESNKRWVAKNPGAVKAITHRRRARKRAANGVLLPGDFDILMAILGDRCLACGSSDRIEWDHVKPLATGGANGPTNFQPLCKSCNCSKGHRRSTDYRTATQVAAIMANFQIKLF